MGQPSSSLSSRRRLAPPLTAAPAASRICSEVTISPTFARRKRRIRSFEPGSRNLQRFLSLRLHVKDQLTTDQLGVRWRNCFVDLAFGHPIDAHRVARSGERTIAAAGHLHEVSPLVRLTEMRLSLVERVNLRMLLMPRDDDLEVGFEKAVADHTESCEHGPAQHHRIQER